MRRIEGEQVLLRLIFSESEHQRHQPLFRSILELLRAEGMAGSTIIKGVAGFGHGRDIHTINIEIASTGLPLIVEVVDSQARIDRVLPKLEPLMQNVLITMERAHVIRYASREPAS